MSKNIEYWKYPQIQRGEVKFVWETSRWDIALSGLCKYRDRYHHFSCCDEGQIIYNEGKWTYDYMSDEAIMEMDDDEFIPMGFHWATYVLYELSEEDAQIYVNQWHDFCKNIGTHCNYNEEGTAREGSLVPNYQDNYEAIYDNKTREEQWKYIKRGTRGPIVGWFENAGEFD